MIMGKRNMNEKRTYIAIDLKSFYASVECVERGLDPLTTNLVVADVSRTEKTICLAVSPSLKALGISGRPRLFEVVAQVKAINAERKLNPKTYEELTYIAATPRMALYIDYSTRIYNIYLKYVAAEDIHVYSIDEVFMDVTHYLKLYGMTAHELTVKIIRDVLQTTGITATAGIGPNLYLCKVAMDIEAKHVPADKDGVRIAELDEISYRQKLWNHKPLTDFWRVGRGYAKKLYERGIFTMGDIARCSLGGPMDIHNEDLLYKLFGINAELLIDHAWGYEPCTMKDIKSYKPQSQSISQGQVLSGPVSFKKALIIAKEMADQVSLDLARKKLQTSQITLSVGYDISTMYAKDFDGDIEADWYGRLAPAMAHGSINLPIKTSASSVIVEKTGELFSRIVDSRFEVRRMYIVASNVSSESAGGFVEEQIDLFTDYAKKAEDEEKLSEAVNADKKIQETLLDIKEKYGKNAILKGMSFEEGATAKERNSQIGGHKA